MIVCKKCGFNNSDADAFCGSCGAFLEWTGEKVTPAPAPAPAHVTPEPAAPVEPARRGGFMALVQQVTAIGVPKKEAIDPPGTTPGAPTSLPGMGGRPSMPATPAPLGAPTPRPLGPTVPPSRPVLGAAGAGPPSIPPRSGPPSAPPRSAPPSAPPSSPPPSGPPRSAPPSGPPPGVGPTSPPPTGPPMSDAPRSAPPIGPPPGATPPPSSPAPVAPSIAKPTLPPPTLPAPTPIVIRVTPESQSSTTPPVTPLQGLQSVAPSAPAEPAGVQPTLVRSRVPPAPTAAPPTKELSAGDLICGQCGEGNEPVRKFCRRCGNSLATAAVAATSGSRKKPKRSAKVLAAGERPEHRTFHFGSVARIAAYVVAAVVVLGGIAYGAVPQVRSDVNSTIQSVTGTVTRPMPVQAASMTASSAIPGHPAARAIDKFSNTYWAASLSTNAQPTLTVSFAKSENVSVVLFVSGDTSDEASVALPKTLHLVFSNGTTQDLTLADTDNAQQKSISGAQDITGMTIQITSVYASASGHPVALGDVEFFGTQ